MRIWPVLLVLGLLVSAVVLGAAELLLLAAREDVRVEVPPPPEAHYVLIRYRDVYQGGIEAIEVDPALCEATAAAMTGGIGSARIVADCVSVRIAEGD